MPVLPFHRYIGPGNPIDSGPCVDVDDCIAKQHDIKYENAKSQDDVRAADLEAIAAFRENWMSGNWHSFIGDVGLSLKYCVETYTGVIYPKLGDFQPCEIISLFNDLLKLHCVNRTRPFPKYRNRSERIIEYRGGEENFFYILVAWYCLCKYRRETNSDVFLAKNRPQIDSRIVDNRRLLETCDLFHLKTWVRFFSLFKIKEREKHRGGYSDDEFGELFLNYD